MKEIKIVGRLIFFLIVICLFIFSKVVFANDEYKSLSAFKEYDAFLFENTLVSEQNILKITNRVGGRYVSSDLSSAAFRLEKNEYMNVDVANIISSTEGTISLWIRPLWNSKEKSSHTFVSFTWNDCKRSYFALSKGWWEPQGLEFLYFICNNQAYSHVHKQVLFEKDRWVHLACVWKGGDEGGIKLFVNGLLVSQGKAPGDTVMRPSGPMFLGSDNGTPLSNGRSSNSDFDDVYIFNQALNDKEIYALYKRDSKKHALGVHSRKNERTEIRAIFDEGTGWMTERGARLTRDRIKRAGFNIYIPCVWHGMGARYNTNVSQKEVDFKLSKIDPLERIIDIAHENNIEVHPWFTVTLRQRNFLNQYYSDKTPYQAFDLHRKNFQNFMIDLISDVVERYDVDGINLDYVRTMGTCVCEECMISFGERSGRDLLSHKNFKTSEGLITKDLQEWHDAAVEEFVRTVSTKIKLIKSDVVVSIDGYLRAGPNQEGRREAVWANKGLVDLVFDMEYGDPIDAERHHLGRSRFVDPNKVVILLANYRSEKGGLVSHQGDELVELVDYTRRRWDNGFGIYIYSMLTSEQIEALSEVNK